MLPVDLPRVRRGEGVGCGSLFANLVRILLEYWFSVSGVVNMF